MKKGLSGRRLVLSVVALVVVIAAIVGTIMWVERNEEKKQAELLAQEAAQMSRSLWTDENTICLDEETFGFDHRIETFLFVGTDLSGGQQIGSSDLRRQPMADFILLMVLDHTKNSIGYLQIDRNTVTEVTGLDEHGEVTGIRPLQICTAHWYGGTQEMAAENLVKAVRKYLGDLENIDGYYVISMRDIEKLNNAVGGVDITLDEDLTDADPAFTKGATVHLTDEQADHYLRARMELADDSNAARMGRQRNYMTGLFSSVRARCLEDAQFAITLWNTLRSAAFTNMNGNDFSRIAQKLMKGENQGIRTVKGEVTTGYRTGEGEAREEFLPDTESLKEELIELFSLVPVDEEEPDEDEDEDEPDEEETEPETEDLDEEDEEPDEDEEEEEEEAAGEEAAEPADIDILAEGEEPPGYDESADGEWIEDEPDEEDEETEEEQGDEGQR